MDNPVYADSLDDFLMAKFQFGFPLQYIQAGLAIWDSQARCVFVNDYVRDMLCIAPRNAGGADENLADLVSRDLIATPQQSANRQQVQSEGEFQAAHHASHQASHQASHPAHQGWSLKKTYITDLGVIYLDIVVRPIIRNGDKKLLGYLSVFQNVTSRHEPAIFEEKLYDLLRCSIKSDSIQETVRQIYNCIEMLGFRDMTVVLFDEKKDTLEVIARVVRGKNEAQPGTWAVDDCANIGNRLVKMTREYQKSQKIATHIQNEADDSDWKWVRPPYVCLPIMYAERLVGFLVLAQSQSHALTPGLYDSAGRTSRFLEELAPVFNRLFVEPRRAEGSRKWANMKDKLETMNLNQKQIQILEMIVKGETNKGIANTINLSEQGVKYHVGNLLEIFDTRNRTELRTKLHQLLNVS